ncbi:phage tail protein [Methylomonas sp. ZR1]|uniref:phage tail protein n=1 Tax=Methylomonas sp. ZR1 TaxID=1797072 RepID=UPI0014924FEE|nr:phage tail protein [Methylomonas sp. ZR1]NOV29160.1 hypothetical protein [Methylomonas sp. ZR1]
MAISPLPPVPLRSDTPAVFIAKADAFLGALSVFRTEANAVAEAMNLGAVTANSTTTMTIGFGGKSLTVDVSKSFVPGMTVKIASTANGANWMLGDVISYNATTGAMVVDSQKISGSGTGISDWTISQSAPGVSETTGVIGYFPVSSAPSGWLKANGAAVSRTVYWALFSLIGTTYGAGDGSTTFNLPDLRGEFLRAWDDGRGVDAGRSLGSVQSGSNASHSHTFITETENAYHSHIDAGHTHLVSANVARAVTGSDILYAGLDGGIPGASYTSAGAATLGNETATHAHDGTTNPTGGTETRPRNVAYLACIKY